MRLISCSFLLNMNKYLNILQKDEICNLIQTSYSVPLVYSFHILYLHPSYYRKFLYWYTWKWKELPHNEKVLHYNFTAYIVHFLLFSFFHWYAFAPKNFVSLELHIFYYSSTLILDIKVETRSFFFNSLVAVILIERLQWVNLEIFTCKERIEVNI